LAFFYIRQPARLQENRIVPRLFVTLNGSYPKNFLFSPPATLEKPPSKAEKKAETGIVLKGSPEHKPVYVSGKPFRTSPLPRGPQSVTAFRFVQTGYIPMPSNLGASLTSSNEVVGRNLIIPTPESAAINNFAKQNSAGGTVQVARSQFHNPFLLSAID